MDIKTTGVHHIALRSGNLERSKQFYSKVLGFPVLMETPIFIFLAGSTPIAVRGPEADSPQEDVFNPFRIGLDHIALACEDESELERVASALSEANVENTGIKTDEVLGKRYIAFKDPDRIAWEFYMV